MPLSSTSLTYFPGRYTDRVWLYDANIPYFCEPGHIVLGVFAILALLLLFLPYTFLLLCGHWLQAKSHWQTLSWTNKIKPFMDAYHAPYMYKKNKRHWIGLFLLIRCVLVLTFALNAVGDNGFNLLVVSSVIAGVSIVKGRVYESCYKDFLESSFILNLCIFSIATFYVSEEKSNDESTKSRIQYTLSSISVGIAFIYFVGIIILHTYKQLKKIKFFSDLINRHTFRQTSDEMKFDEQSLERISSTTVSLQQLLLDNN